MQSFDHPRARSAVVRVCAMMLAALALLSSLWFDGPAAAASPLTSGPARQAPAADTAMFVKLAITNVTPSSVTATSDPVLTVTGTASNIGDRPVADVEVRLQRGDAIARSSGLRSSLLADQANYDVSGQFSKIADTLGVGQIQPFTLSLPLNSATMASLAIDSLGVYPLLVNVNGTPQYGGRARLDVARFLLPVTGLPSPTTTPGTPAPHTPPRSPSPLTVLWPLADRPRLSAGFPAGTVQLADDDLAQSLASGGRLDNLLSSIDAATRPESDPNGQLAQSVCLAIDPDLLVTVNAMTGDYLVSNSADNPGGGAHPGTGKVAATEWLNHLRDLARRLCFAPMPYAQTDLDALARVTDPALQATALNNSGDILDQILGSASQRGATLGTDRITEDSAALLSAQGSTTVITPSANLTEQQDNSGPAHITASVSAVPFDDATGTALAAAGATPTNPSYADSDWQFPLTRDSAAARLQNALGAIAFDSLAGQRDPTVVVPPNQWDVTAAEASSVLGELSTLLRSGLAIANPLTRVILAAQSTTDTADVTDHLGNDAAVDLAPAVSTQIARVWGLTDAIAEDARTGTTGTEYTAPLREDLLRALSRAATGSASTQRVDLVRATMDNTFASVSVVNPGRSLTLASEQSPLLLVVRNTLPLPIRVRLVLQPPPGTTVSDIGEQLIPASGSVQLTIPTVVRANRQLVIDVGLTTPSGIDLGNAVRLSVHSNAYGAVLFALTLGAGALLVALSARRLWHRFRGKPDRADARAGSPDPARQEWP